MTIKVDFKSLCLLWVMTSVCVTAVLSQEAELVHLWQFDGDTEDGITLSIDNSQGSLPGSDLDWISEK